MEQGGPVLLLPLVLSSYVVQRLRDVHLGGQIDLRVRPVRHQMGHHGVQAVQVPDQTSVPPVPKAFLLHWFRPLSSPRFTVVGRLSNPLDDYSILSKEMRPFFPSLHFSPLKFSGMGARLRLTRRFALCYIVSNLASDQGRMAAQRTNHTVFPKAPGNFSLRSGSWTGRVSCRAI